MLPIVGKTYRHFKGNLYEVKAISQPLLNRRRTYPVIYTCQHTDVANLAIHVCEGDIHDPTVCDATLVIYDDVNHRGEHWARPLESWLKPVDESTPRFVLEDSGIKLPSPEELRNLRFKK